MVASCVFVCVFWTPTERFPIVYYKPHAFWAETAGCENRGVRLRLLIDAKAIN